MLLERLEEAKSRKRIKTRTSGLSTVPKFPKNRQPSEKLNLAVGILLGLMVGGALAFFEMRNTTVDTPEDVERIAGFLSSERPNINTFSKR